jgi:hypothetical protein
MGRVYPATARAQPQPPEDRTMHRRVHRWPPLPYDGGSSSSRKDSTSTPPPRNHPWACGCAATSLVSPPSGTVQWGVDNNRIQIFLCQARGGRRSFLGKNQRRRHSSIYLKPVLKHKAQVGQVASSVDTRPRSWVRIPQASLPKHFYSYMTSGPHISGTQKQVRAEKDHVTSRPHYLNIFLFHCSFKKILFICAFKIKALCIKKSQKKCCKGILPLTFILINNDKQASDDLMCLASLICRF